MKCWALRWVQWGDVDDFWMEIFWTRREAINHALAQWYSQEEITAKGRRNLWRRLQRKGIRVVKAELIHARTSK